MAESCKIRIKSAAESFRLEIRNYSIETLNSEETFGKNLHWFSTRNVLEALVMANTAIPRLAMKSAQRPGLPDGMF
jgi:hypothetical protein